MAEVGAVVFDFDGVLANSEPLHLQAYQAVLGEAGVTLGRDEYYQHYLGFDDATMLSAVSDRRGLGWNGKEISEFVARKTVIFDEIVASTDVIYPGAVACVERLAAALPRPHAHTRSGAQRCS